MPYPPMCNWPWPLDFIEFFDKRRVSVFKLVAPLYKKGLSVSDIAKQTDIGRSSVYKALRTNRDILRPPVSVPF